MAIDTNSYFSNAVQGMTQVGADYNIYEHNETPKYQLGTRIKRQDGNEYVYVQFSQDADMNPGVLCAVDASESSVADTDNVIVAPASAQTTTDGTLGSKFVEITLASVTANQYAGGYFVTTDDTGEGYTYRIKGNTATGNPASGNFRLELHDALVVALDATTDFAIQGCLYANVEIATAATDVALAGVNVKLVDVSETGENYGWVQTKGVCGILQDGTIAIGDIVTLSDGVNGAVQVGGGGGTSVADLVAEQYIGTCLIAGDNTGHGVFNIAVN